MSHGHCHSTIYNASTTTLLLDTLEFANGGEQVHRVLNVIDRMHGGDLRLDAEFFIDQFLLDFALEDPVGKGGTGKGRVVGIAGGMTIAGRIDLIGRLLAQQGFGRFVKKGDPGRTGLVFDDGTKDPSSDAMIKGLLTPFAMPGFPMARYGGGRCHLDAIATGIFGFGTGRVPGTAFLVLFQKGDSAGKGNVIALFRLVTQLFSFNVGNFLAFGKGSRSAKATAATTAETFGRTLSTRFLIPRLQAVIGGQFLNARFILGEHDRVKTGQGFAAPIIGQARATHAHKFIQWHEGGGLLDLIVPQSQINLRLGIVHQSDIAFGKFLSLLFGQQGDGVTNGVDIGQDIHVRVFFGIDHHGFNRGNGFDKIVGMRLNVGIVMGHVNFGILVKGDFVR